MIEKKYRLSGKEKRVCPKCGRRSLSLFVDEQNAVVDESCGKCDHEKTCGYFYAPWDLFKDNPWLRESSSSSSSTNSTPPPPPQPIGTLSMSLVPISTNSTLFKYLRKFFTADDITAVAEKYHLSATMKGETIFPQIDLNGKLRTGKIMAYGADGHRIKGEVDKIDWLHTRYLKAAGIPRNSFSLVQCLFGEHLLSSPGKVCIVESEKSALIGSLALPEYIWLATGGKGGLNAAKFAMMGNRDVILFPDADAADEWKKKLPTLAPCCKSVRLSNWWADEPTGSKRDVADLLLAELAPMNDAPMTPPPPTEQEQEQPMTVATVATDDEVMTANTTDDDRELSLKEVVEWCAGNLQPGQWAVGKYPPLPWEKE